MIICSAISDAAVNTVICLLMVFAVLIFISFLISLFKYIPKLEAFFAGKKENKTELAETAADNTVSQIEVKEEAEELSDDLELVAVITAAIAASTKTSTEGFTVRSIRRSNNSKWAKA